jgi:hypothetical protein
MESDDRNTLVVIHSDPPTFDYPCVSFMQSILYDIDTTTEPKDGFLDKFTDYILIELEITKSAFWCYESSVFERLIFESEVYLILHSEKLSESTIKAINDCICLLKFLALKKENLETLPNDFKKYERLDFSIERGKQMRIESIFCDSFVKCPSCSLEFSQIAFNVLRSPYAFKCPKCHQSIAI